MAIIQNSDVIQKLVDELGLSPALEKIPTELAEKVLPVFQVNSETITLQAKPNYILWQDATANDSDKTLTVPDGHTYVLKQGFIKYASSADVGNRVLTIEIQDAAGNTVWVAEQLDADKMEASKTHYFRLHPNSRIIDKEGAANYHTIFTFPLAPDFVMLEGWTIRVWDYEAIAAAADDMEVSFIVDDQED